LAINSLSVSGLLDSTGILRAALTQLREHPGHANQKSHGRKAVSKVTSESEGVTNLKSFLGMAAGAGSKTDALLLSKGKEYTVDAQTYKHKLPMGNPHECYANAGRAVLGNAKGHTYIEGYISVHGVPIQHAWLADRQGRVRDVTLKDGRGIEGYFGVPFKPEYIVKTATTTKVWGILHYTNRKSIESGDIKQGVQESASEQAIAQRLVTSSVNVQSEVQRILREFNPHHDQDGRFSSGASISITPVHGRRHHVVGVIEPLRMVTDPAVAKSIKIEQALGLDQTLEWDTNARGKIKAATVKALAAKLVKNEDFMKLADFDFAMGGRPKLSSIQRAEEFVDVMIHSWAGTSGDHSARSVYMQHMAAKEFGLKADTKHMMPLDQASRSMAWSTNADGGKVPSSWKGSYAKQPFVNAEPGTRAFLREQYNQTQAIFKKHGITEIALHRGFFDPPVEPRRPGGSTQGRIRQAKIGDTVTSTMQPISSFSSQARVANQFGSTTISSKVPVNRILSTVRSGYGASHEYEFTVLGGKVRGLVTRQNP